MHDAPMSTDDYPLPHSDANTRFELGGGAIKLSRGAWPSRHSNEQERSDSFLNNGNPSTLNKLSSSSRQLLSPTSIPTRTKSDTHTKQIDRLSAEPASTIHTMPKFRSFSNLARKAKKEEERENDGSREEGGISKSSSWRLKPSRSFSNLAKLKNSHRERSSGSNGSSEAMPKSPAYIPPIPARGSSSSSPIKERTTRKSMTASASQLPPHLPPSPMSISSRSRSSYDVAEHSLSPSPYNTSKGLDRSAPIRQSTRENENDFLLPPQPAFLGGRSCSAPGLNALKSSNSSVSSLISISSSQNNELDSTFHESLGNTRGRLSIKTDLLSPPRHLSEGEARSASPSMASGPSLRSFGRRFLSRMGASPSTTTIDVASNHRPSFASNYSDTAPQITSLLHEGSMVSSPTEELYPPTPPLSSNSATTQSSSSCTSSVTNSPLLLPINPFLSLPPSVATASNRGSFQSTKRSDMPVSPLSSVPTSVSLSPPAGNPNVSVAASGTEKDDNSDFLKAVLNFASSDVDLLPIPEPQMFSSIKRTSFSTQKQGNKVLTQTDVKRLLDEETRQKTDSRMTGMKNLRSIWTKHNAADDDSEDEYGDEGDVVEAVAATNPHSKPTLFQRTAVKGLLGPGLNTAAKKAAFTCTLMKFHPQLATALSNNQGQSSNTVSDIRLPRSANSANLLESHPSSSSHIRSMRKGLARGKLLRRLRTESLPLSMERELDWFVKKYLPHFIAPEELASQLAKRAAQSSLEALARPPLPQGKDNGMAVWANRLPFEERCKTYREEGNDSLLGNLQIDVGHVINERKFRPTTMPLQLSKRCQALAGIQVAGRHRETKPLSSSSHPPVKQTSLPSNETKLTSSPSRLPRRQASPWASASTKVEVNLSQSANRASVTNSNQLLVPSSPNRVVAPSANRVGPVYSEEDESSEEEEDVPLAMLVDRRARKSFSERSPSESGPSTEEFSMRVQQQRERELAVRRTRELKLLEDQKRLLNQARERRKKTDHAEVLSSPTYGAGNPLMDVKRRNKAIDEPSSSSFCAGEDNGTTTSHHRDSTFSHLHPVSPSRKQQTRNSMTSQLQPISPTKQQRLSYVSQSPSPKLQTSSSFHDAGPSSWRGSRLSPVSPPSRKSSQVLLEPIQSIQSSNSLHRLSGFPLAMAPYGYIPMPPPAMHHHQSMAMLPSLYQSQSSPHLPHPSPLVYLSPEQIPSSARHSRIGVATPV